MIVARGEKTISPGKGGKKQKDSSGGDSPLPLPSIPGAKKSSMLDKSTTSKKAKGYYDAIEDSGEYPESPSPVKNKNPGVGATEMSSPTGTLPYRTLTVVVVIVVMMLLTVIVMIVMMLLTVIVMML